MKARREEATRVIRQAAAVCLGYPERDVIATSGLRRAALAESALRQAESFEPLQRPGPRSLGRSRPITLMPLDLSRKHSLYLSDWTDGDTRRRGEAAAFSSGTAARVSWSIPGASCPTICRWSWTTRQSSMQSMEAHCCSSTEAAWSCYGWL